MPIARVPDPIPSIKITYLVVLIISCVKRIILQVTMVVISLLTRAQESASPMEPFQQSVPGTPVQFRMVPIPSGTFTMGSGEPSKPDEGPARQVELSAFWMQSLEVTHDEFLVFFDDEQFSRNADVDAVTRPTPQYIDLSWGMGKQGGFPANSMSQHTALMYCRWLYKKTGVFYRLPTEAEWEYACKAGKPFAVSNKKELDEIAWHAGNSQGRYHKTGTKKPNAWGLYDMLGNVAEWTLDQYDENYFSKIENGAKDPLVAATSRYPRSVRGGSYEHPADQLRCTARFHSAPSWNKRDPQIPKSKWWLTDAAFVGFRVVEPLKQPSAEEAAAFYEQFSSK